MSALGRQWKARHRQAQTHPERYKECGWTEGNTIAQDSVYVRRSLLPSSSSSSSPAAAGCGCCGFCRVCTCVRWNVACNSAVGIAKTIETVISLVCECLLLSFGSKYSSELGWSFSVLLSAASASALVSFLLLVSYVVSEEALANVRPSIFEVLFGFVCSCLFLTSASFLTMSVHANLFYYYNTLPGFQAYPAMTAAYVLGFMLGVVHAIDAFLALRDLRNSRSL